MGILIVFCLALSALAAGAAGLIATAQNQSDARGYAFETGSTSAS